MNEQSEQSPAEEQHDMPRDEETSDRSPGQSDPERASARGGGGRVLGGLALVLALAVAGWNAWQWWQARESGADWPGRERLEAQSDRLGELDARVDRIQSDAQSVESELAELAGAAELAEGERQSLGRDLASATDRDEQLARRVDSLERTLGRQGDQLERALEAREQGRAQLGSEAAAEASRRLALAEVAGLLRLGRARAVLAGDIDGALAAFEQARERLRASDDARLARIDELVADDIGRLEALDRPDWSRLAERLNAIGAQVPDWPAAGSAVPAETEPADTNGETGWWQSMRDSLGGLVRVSPREQAALPESAFESVRERLRLHLVAAQTAAARRESGEMSQHLQAVQRLIERWFDVGADAVARALDEIAEIRQVRAPEPPRLDAALDEANRLLDAS